MVMNVKMSVDRNGNTSRNAPSGSGRSRTAYILNNRLFLNMNLKRVRKRDLCALIRFLNFYYLNQDRIHYFSIRVKQELVNDLARLYSIRELPEEVHFVPTYPPLPLFVYQAPMNQWLMDGKRVSLPRSRKECVRRLHISRGPVTLTFT